MKKGERSNSSLLLQASRFHKKISPGTGSRENREPAQAQALRSAQTAALMNSRPQASEPPQLIPRHRPPKSEKPLGALRA